TGSHRPVRSPPHRIPVTMRAEVEKQVDDLIKAGIVEPSCSEWSSPVVLVPKADGSARMCIDYRKQNKLSKRPAYPLPVISDLIDTLNGARYFSAIDQTWGYLQVPLDEKSKERGAFVTHHGHFQPTRMFFGLVGAPATFQSLMDLVLSGLQWK